MNALATMFTFSSFGNNKGNSCLNINTQEGIGETIFQPFSAHWNNSGTLTSFAFCTDSMSPNSSLGMPQHFSVSLKTTGILFTSKHLTVSSTIFGSFLFP